MKAIASKNAPVAIGPYSQAVDTGEFVFLSGQLPLDPETMEICDGIENQTIQVLKNIEAILNDSQMSLKNIVKFTIFITSMDDFPIVNEIYGNYLSQPYPARSTVEVSRLPKDAKIEMEVIAKKQRSE